MNPKRRLLETLSLIVTFSMFAIFLVGSGRPQFAAAAAAAAASVTPTSRPSIVYSTFEENLGQFDPEVRFATGGSNYAAYLTTDGVNFTVSQTLPITDRRLPHLSDPQATIEFPELFHYEEFRLRFVNSNPNVNITPEDKQVTTTSYFRGTQDQWIVNVPIYAQVVYRELYADIDVVYAGYGYSEWLPYYVQIAAGADPGVIRLAYEDTQGLSLDADGNLLIAVGTGGNFQQIKIAAPVASQVIAGVRQSVPVRYELQGSEVTFVLGDFDPTVTLYID